MSGLLRSPYNTLKSTFRLIVKGFLFSISVRFHVFKGAEGFLRGNQGFKSDECIVSDLVKVN